MLFLQLLADGLVGGCAIGLVAVSFSLIYSTTGVFHVAHAGVYSLGAYVAWYASTLGAPFIVACACAAAISAGVGAGIQAGLYETLARRKATPLVLLIASLGALAMLQNALAMLFTPNILQFPNAWRIEVVNLGGVQLSYAQVLTALASVALFAGLMWLTRRTSLGRRIRAVSLNRVLAEVVRLRPHVVVA